MRRFLDIQNIECLPANVSSLQNLEELSIRGSASFPTCPWTINNPKLTLLNLDYNRFTGSEAALHSS